VSFLSDQNAESGRALEERVTAYFAGHGYRVRPNAIVPGRSGASHEIDVLADKADELTTVTIAVECKAWRQPIEKDVVAKLDMVIRDAGINKGILVCPGGWRAGAEAMARDLGIELWGPSEVEHHLGAEAFVGTRPGHTTISGLALPVRTSPEKAVATLQRHARGALGLGRRSAKIWSEPVWIPATEFQIAITRLEGALRKRPVVTRVWNLYELLTGTLLGSRTSPRPFEMVDFTGPSVRSLVRDTKIRGDLTKAFERYRSVSSQAALERHALALSELGVQAPLASLEVEEARQVHLPFFVGLFSKGDQQRFVAIYGDDGEDLPAASSALTSKLGHVLGCIGQPTVDPERPIVSTDPTAKPTDAVPTSNTPQVAAEPSGLSPGPCSCGGELIQRRRKSDGQPFWGCSRFPTCRQTRPRS
jgi:Restriction endonuclease